MNNFYYSVFLIFLLIGCSSNSGKMNYLNVAGSFQLYKEKYDSIYIKKSITSNKWMEVNNDIILQENPDFILRPSDKLDYISIPALNIPIENFLDYNDDFLNYINSNQLELNQSELLVFINEKLSLIFTIYGNVGITYNNMIITNSGSFLSNFNLSFFKTGDVYFKINIIGKKGVYPIPGVFLIRDNMLYTFRYDGKIFYSYEFYKVVFNAKDDFNAYIDNIVNIETLKNE